MGIRDQIEATSDSLTQSERKLATALLSDYPYAGLISIQELTFLANEVAATTTKVFETWILVGAMYFVLCYSFAVLFANLEKRATRSRR